MLKDTKHDPQYSIWSTYVDMAAGVPAASGTDEPGLCSPTKHLKALQAQYRVG